MTIDEIDKINAMESSHWWYRGTREICMDQIARQLRGGDHAILDIGCGTGGNLQAMQAFGRASGIDTDPRCLEWCRKKGLDVAAGDMLQLSLPPAHYDLVTMFDVLNQAPPEQMGDVLSNIRDGLRTNGLMVLREPALSIASGLHDLEVGIRKRFDRVFLRSLLAETGFALVSVTYLNTFLFPPIVAMRKLQLLFQSEPRSDVQAVAAPLNALLLNVLRVERLLLRFQPLPFGVSLLAIARKI